VSAWAPPILAAPRPILAAPILAAPILAAPILAEPGSCHDPHGETIAILVTMNRYESNRFSPHAQT
jgi:hypothetical protein